ncbi:DUF4383 domain-containing protein [Mycolicibacterium pyrenivorans]|uniref:DUF4383 domain-containing protein n=1 Tax=Mycolicibacterium pyrenivorans TaxID=187102 RepID=UPI0021F2B764|nr:DUF4383 domain-containing protein [Mycolicibacterium pyrenivorans]MCV7150020.1 DUF4383 domain-containing protein [Mycolicibacterium pyrenivorans]
MSAPKYMAVQGAAMIMATALAAIGVLGFLPGVTTHLDQLTWAGQRSGAMLFGTFAVSALLNLVHVVIGLVGFPLARSYAGARAYLLGAGVIYVALWLYGAFVERGSDAHVIPLNTADNLLHIGLGGVMLLLAVTLGGQHDPTKRRSRVRQRPSTAGEAT